MIGMKKNIGPTEALASLRPNTQWIIRDNDYSKLEWHSAESTPPSQEEIDAEIARLTALEPMRVLREIRNWLIKETDWTQSADLRKIRGDTWCEQWDTYRQALRDITKTATPQFDQFGILVNIAWPAAPTET
jgi:hypothetical protein